MSNKMPLQWHKDTLACYERSLDEKKKELKRTTEYLTSYISRMTADIEFTKKQIEAAIAKGMDGFDDERFMKKEREEVEKVTENIGRGFGCPVCHSTDTEGETTSFDTQTKTWMAECRCPCGAKWNVVFLFQCYTNIRPKG